MASRGIETIVRTNIVAHEGHRNTGALHPSPQAVILAYDTRLVEPS
jgi:hypothetical protein